MSARYSAAELAGLLGLAAPTGEQATVIEAPLCPTGVVAGAGSGKTSTMAARVVWLVANGLVAPEGVLGLTFTRKAASELSLRVRQRLDLLRSAGLLGGRTPGSDADGLPAVSTYHSYAGRLVTEHALREAVEPRARVIRPAVQWQVAASVVGRYEGPMDAVDKGPSWVIDAVLALAGELGEHLREPAELRAELERWSARVAAAPGRRTALATRLLATASATRALLPLVESYAAAKADRGVLDYGDQIALAARIALRHPEVGRMERSRYPVVLLDEYQDTGHAQRELLRALYGGGHPVTAVGDPCQSIYGWRGASAGGLRRFPEHFASGGKPAAVHHLATSFRNAERILTVANRLAEPLRACDPGVPVLRAAPAGATGGRVECALLETHVAEADWVADRVAAAVTAGTSAGEVAVLCRKRSQFPMLRTAFERRGIPVEVVGLGGLLTVPDVLDVISMLQVLEDTTANDAVVRLLTGARMRLGARDLVALGRRAQRLARPQDGPGAVVPDEARLGSLVEALDHPGPASAYSEAGYARLHALATQVSQLRERTDQPLPDLVADVERALGLDVEVAARGGAGAISGRADLDAFADAAADFAGAEEEPTLRAFMAYLRAAEDEEFGLEMGRVGTGDSVKIVTVHAAKGLEWPVVALPGLSAGASSSLFPARPRTNSKWTHNPRLLPFPLRGDVADLPGLPGLDAASGEAFTAACIEREQLEERRLAYVAVTRAARLLLCSGFWWGEGTTRVGPSCFLTEIRDVLAADPGAAAAGTVALWAPEPPPDAPNPLRATPPGTVWPEPPGGPAYEALVAAAHQVQAWRRGSQTSAPPEPPAGDELGAADLDLVRAWDTDARLLLAERAAIGRAGPPREVPLPERLTVSQLVRVARDPDGLARALRRPTPQRPAPSARRGTAFHAWLETHYGQLQLLDLDELAGASDEPAASEPELIGLQQAFRRSTWWSRTPVEVEVPFDAQLAGLSVRGRIDAVFADADGGWTVVDWKTGRVPPAADAAAAAVQLAAYRLAWAALAGAAVQRVRAGFHYVPDNVTVQPVDLLDEPGLRQLIETVPMAAEAAAAGRSG